MYAGFSPGFIVGTTDALGNGIPFKKTGTKSSKGRTEPTSQVRRHFGTDW
jgi:hypothetical protein